MRAFIIALWVLLSVTEAFSQKQIKGKVKNAKGGPISSANVNLKDKEGSILNFTRTNDKGDFSLAFAEDAKGARLEISIIGYEKKVETVDDPAKIFEFILQESNINLKTIVVKNRPSLALKGDTLNYKTSDFADKQDRTIGDVLKKMPGITVEEDGKIAYNGKGISNLYIDGDNVLNDKYNIGTKSITHGVVDKVQVIEKDQPIKMLRKNNTSDDIALNLVIKDEAKIKIMGELKAGLGTPNRYDGNINTMMFRKNFKFINNIKSNNIGVDPGIDVTAHNLASYLKRLDNNKPANFLSAGAAGVPTLPQNRTLFNNAALVNLNNLYKFNADVQLRANLSYLYDNRNQQYVKFSETYLQEQTISYHEWQVNTLKPQKLQAEFNLNGNAEKYYLNNTFLANYSPIRTNSTVIINEIGAGQSLYQQAFDLSNEFSYRKKFKSDDILNFYTYINRSTQPETLSIRPGLNEAILNNGNPFAGLNQYIKLPTWYTHNFLSLAVVKSKFTQTYKAGFNWQKQDLNSALFRLQNNLTTELVAPEMSNHLTWHKTKLFTEGTYDYTTEKFKAGLSLPISYNIISYKDPSKALAKNLEKLFINPSLNFRYQTSVENYVMANYSFNNDLGGLDDIYQGTILKNYRSLFANNAPITERKTHSVGAGFNYRKAIQMFFLNFNVAYTHSQLNTISSYTLTNNIQQRVVLPLSNGMQSFMFSSAASKYLFNWRSTISLSLSYLQTQFDQLQNGKLLPFTSAISTYKMGIDSKLNNFMNCTYNATYILSSNSTANTNFVKNNNQQIRQQAGVTATAFKSVFINLSAEHIFTHQNQQANLSYLFADLNLRYKFIKIKTDLEFGLSNLANIKSFEAINLSANTFTQGIYDIPGRVALLKATFNF